MVINAVRFRVLGWAALFTLLTLCGPFGAVAHDIPNDVLVHAFVKPEGDRLRVLLRVPLHAMRDTEFPQRGPGYLDFARLDTLVEDAAKLWLADSIEMYEGGVRLPGPRLVAALVALPSDTSFTSYEEALAHVTGPGLPHGTDVYWDQTMLDALFEYPIQSDQSRFSVHPALARLGQRVVTVMRFLPPGGAVRAFEFEGDPGLVRLDPTWHQAALGFVRSGFFHILDGVDHLLFLFCLVVPFRRFRALIPVVTAFTVAHSITLIASAYNLGPDSLWFPPLIELLIAASIVYMGVENIVGLGGVQHRWMLAFGFGLVHGFGFSFALKQTLQFAGSHLLTSLLAFNVGVELGQLLMLLLFIPVLEFLFRRVVAERIGTIIVSALVVHTAWHWMIDRGAVLSQYRWSWPTVNLALLAKAGYWMTFTVAIAALMWLVFGVLRYRAERSQASKAARLE